MLSTTYNNRAPQFVGASATYLKPDITHPQLIQLESLMRKSSLGGLIYSLDFKVQKRIVEGADNVLATLSDVERGFKSSLMVVHWAVFHCDFGCQMKHLAHFEPECAK